jgi:uncharacterized phosphatase
MKHFYHVRHGLSEMNKLGKVSSSTDTKLTEEGRAQAKKAGISAKDFGIDLVVSSPLSRAYDTATIIADEIGIDKNKVLTSDLLKERPYGDLEGTEYSLLKTLNIEDYAGVESWDDLSARAKKAVEWIKSLEAESVLVVSHGSIGRALRQVIKPDVDVRLKLDNAKIEKWL